MRNHKTERIARKPIHCLSMRQRRRIRQEVKLIQESATVENKRNQSENSITQGENNISVNSPNIIYVQSEQRVPQFVQQSTNSFSTIQDNVDPLLTVSTISDNLVLPITFLPGPSGYEASNENGLSSTLKIEPFTENNQQTSFNHQDNNSDILLELR